MILPFKYWRQKRLWSNAQGFSLIETMVVIAIMAIAAGMTIPNLLSYRPAYELNRAANDLYSNLQWTRLTAIRESINCRLVIDTGNNEYRVEMTDTNGNTHILRQILIAITYENSGITLSSTGDGTVTFSARGMRNPPDNTITVSNNGGSFNIQALSSGVVRKERGL